MTMGPALLIAHGGPGDAFHDRAFEQLGKRAPRVAYVGAANRDQAAWYLRVSDTLRTRHGARVELARTMVDNPAPARGALEDADLIYLAGGDVQLLATRMRVLGLDAVLRSCHAAGAMLLGISAGAVALGPSWIAFPDDYAGGEDDRVRRFPCVGAFPFAIDCHDEDGDWEELRALLARWALDDPKAAVEAYGIPHGGALEVDARGKLNVLGTPPKRLRLDHGQILE